MPKIEEIKLKPVGYVKRLAEKENVKDRSLITRVIIREDLTQALEGIKDFSHLYVVFYMHQISEVERKPLRVHPHGRLDLPLLGVFATRTASRPNPIGLTLVELLERRSNVLVVRGLDALDGTPVLDLKPADKRDMTMKVKTPQWLKLLENEKHAAKGSRNIDLRHNAKKEY